MRWMDGAEMLNGILKQIFDIILAIYVHRWDEKNIYIIDPTDI